MPLTPSTRIGSYEVVALIGEGGMGQVYRARDLRLGRDVALKVLPAALIADDDSAVALRPGGQSGLRAQSPEHPHDL
jgi:serine/threonine protein kinase